jgi:hypothetical protein
VGGKARNMESVIGYILLRGGFDGYEEAHKGY